MIKVKLTVINDETDYGRNIEKKLTMDEFKGLFKAAPLKDFPDPEFVIYLRDAPIKALFNAMIDYMTHDTVENRDKYLEEPEKTDA